VDLRGTRYETIGSTGIIFLSRPERRNAWTGRMHTEYRWLLAEAEADPAVRVVVVTGGDASLVAVTLGEVLATSDVPAGVVNVLTGERAELLPWLISHLDVNAVDLTGADDDLEAEVVAEAAANVKRVVFGDVEEESPYAIADFMEMKTLWHPIGR